MNPTLAPQPRTNGRGEYILPIRSFWVPSRLLGHVLFFGAHIPLGLLMSQSSTISTAHAVLAFMAGLYFAVVGNRLERVAYVAAYITGAEALWRMTRAGVYWEFGKYAVIAILLVSIIRSGRLRAPIWALLYFFLLLPSAVMPMSNMDTAELRNQISFNLSGPLALVISAWFFHGIELKYSEMKKLFAAIIGPTIGVAAVALFSTLSAKAIFFTNNSNFVTSGGFGPNQVSAALALGALLAFLLAMDSMTSLWMKALMLTVVVFLAIQSALTFSRGGLYTGIGAAILSAFFLLRTNQSKLRVIGGIILLVLLTNFLIIPQLDEFTGGALSKRFANTKLTGRDKLIMADLKAWNENPLFGVGPGQAKNYHGEFRAGSIAHTEFSRMLAEHGILGMVAAVILIVIAVQNLLRSWPGTWRAITVAMITWSFFYMLTAAMRLVAPSFAFALTSVRLAPDTKDPENGI